MGGTFLILQSGQPKEGATGTSGDLTSQPLPRFLSLALLPQKPPGTLYCVNCFQEHWVPVPKWTPFRMRT